MKKLMTFILALCALRGEAQEIAGKIVDPRKEPLIESVVLIKQKGVLKADTRSDYDGFYLVKSLEPGYYDVTVCYNRQDSQTTTMVPVLAGARTTQNFRLAQSNGNPGHTIVPYYKKPTTKVDPATIQKPTLLEPITSPPNYICICHGSARSQGNTTLMDLINGVKVSRIDVLEKNKPLIDSYNPTSFKLTEVEVKSLPTENINDMASLWPSVYQRQRGAELNIAGAGSYSTLYVIDGMQIAR